MSTEFDKLIGDLDTLHKALPKGDELDDEKIEAAKKGGAASEDGKRADKEVDVKKEEGGGKKKELAKSLTVKLEDGTEVEAVDGTELVKSLTDSLGALTTRFDDNESSLTKAFARTIDLLKAQTALITGQGTLITGMQSQVKEQGETIKAMAGEGRGRKAIVTMVEKKPEGTTLAKGGEGGGGMSPNDFMAKAESQFKAGRLGGNELAYIESSFNRGEFNLPTALISKVTAAA